MIEVAPVHEISMAPTTLQSPQYTCPNFQVEAEWRCESSPEAKERMSFQLTQKLPQTSVVCCVRFSPCGTMLATGSNRASRLFDVNTGNQIWFFHSLTAFQF